jgi:hypothetical protein
MTRFSDEVRFALQASAGIIIAARDMVYMQPIHDGYYLRSSRKSKTRHSNLILDIVAH